MLIAVVPVQLSVTAPASSISRLYHGTVPPSMARSVGTLMVCLPWPHRGGALVYEEAGYRVCPLHLDRPTWWQQLSRSSWDAGEARLGRNAEEAAS